MKLTPFFQLDYEPSTRLESLNHLSRFPSFSILLFKSHLPWTILLEQSEVQLRSICQTLQLSAFAPTGSEGDLQSRPAGATAPFSLLH